MTTLAHGFFSISDAPAAGDAINLPFNDCPPVPQDPLRRPWQSRAPAVPAPEPPGDIVGGSPALRRAMAQVQQVAATDSTVLLLGETGTGKELFATEVHRLGARRARAMVRVNCASIPDTLIEAELFGHEKGAFTGAWARQTGRFELADHSTIFLDEIGDLAPD